MKKLRALANRGLIEVLRCNKCGKPLRKTKSGKFICPKCDIVFDVSRGDQDINETDLLYASSRVGNPVFYVATSNGLKEALQVLTTTSTKKTDEKDDEQPNR